MNTANNSCAAHIETKLRKLPFAEDILPIVEKLRKMLPDTDYNILVYGSYLSPVTRSKTSTPDFFVVIENDKEFYSKWFERCLDRILPPNIYHFSHSGMSLKYSVVRRERLIEELSMKAKDVYLLGRFSKRMVLCEQRKNSESFDVFAKLQHKAMLSVATMILSDLPDSFSVEDFARLGLQFSYTGDVRVEAADKIERLFTSEKEFYLQCYQALALELVEQNLLQKGAENRFQKNPSVDWNEKEKERQSFVARSRKRAKQRWPKAMFTASNWLDYVVQKLERTQGPEFNLSEKEKRYWYIYGWKYVFLLRKKKLIK